MNPLALDYISISGFKSIASIEKLPLRPINILIGANGSGKSNFIGAFAMLKAIFEERLGDYVIAAGGADKILHFGSKVTSQIVFDLCNDSKNKKFHLLLMRAGTDDLLPKIGLKVDFFPTITFDLDQWRIYHLHDTSSKSPMRLTATVDDNRFLRADASNLAAFLYLLKEQHNDSYQLIRKTVARVAPFFHDFALSPLRLNPNSIKLEWKHKNSDSYFDAASFSDGTLRFIALATLLLQPVELRPSLILIDEPELGLHPYAIGLLASMIQSASVETQFIISTQSSSFIDYFQPEDVLVADRKQGSTHLTRLDSKSLEVWLEDYSLGQLWEKNEFGGRPSQD
jgi:predicted ATPase